MTKAQLIERFKKDPTINPADYERLAAQMLASALPDTGGSLQSASNPDAVKNARLLQAYQPQIEAKMQEGLDNRVARGIRQMEQFGYDPTETHYKPSQRDANRAPARTAYTPDENARRAGTFSGRSGVNALGMWEASKQALTEQNKNRAGQSAQWYDGEIAKRTQELSALQEDMQGAEARNNMLVNEWQDARDAALLALGDNPTADAIDAVYDASERELETIHSAHTGVQKKFEALRSEIYELERQRDALAVEDAHRNTPGDASPAKTGAVTVNRGKSIVAKMNGQKHVELFDTTGDVADLSRFMTQEQKDIINTLANKGLWDEVSQYYDLIRPELGKERYGEISERIDTLPKAGQVAMAAVGGAAAPAAFGQVAADLLREKITGEYRPVNMYDSGVGATRLAQQAQGRSIENLSPTGQFLANTAYSMAQSGAVMPFGPVVGPLMLASSAAGHQAIDTLEKGGSKTQASVMGAAAGAFEYFAERIPFENLFKAAGKIGKSGVRDMVLEVAKQAGIEAAEELATEIANHVFDMAYMGAESEYNTLIRELQDGGMSYADARRAASTDTWKQFGLAAAGGALSGGLFGAGGQAISSMQSKRTGQSIIADGAVGDFVAEGLKQDRKTDAYQYAARMQEAMERGKRPSNTDMAELYAALPDASIDNINEAVTKRRREVINKDVPQQADVTLQQADARPQVYTDEISRIINESRYDPTDDIDVGMLYDELRDVAPGQFPDTDDVAAQRERIAAYEATPVADAAPAVTETAPVVETSKYYKPGESYTAEQIQATVARSAAEHGVHHVQALEMADVARKLNVRAEYQSLGENIKGFYDKNTGAIILNANSDTPFTTVFAHELVHHVENTGAYADLERLVLNDTDLNQRLTDAGITMEQLFDTKMRMYQSAGIETDITGARQEFIADYVATEFLSNPDALTGIAADAKTDSGKRRLLSRVLDFVERILGKVNRTETIRPQENLNLEQVQAILKNALGETADAAPVGSVMQDAAPQGSAPQFMVGDGSIDALFEEASRQYGNLKPSPQYVSETNPNFKTRDFNAPAQMSDETRTRRSYQTAANAPALSDATAAEIRAAIPDRGQYEPISNVQTLEKAHEARAKYSTFEAARGALQQFADDFRAKRANEMVALGELLLLEASDRGDYAAAQAIMTDVGIMLTDMGQGIQAWSIMHKLSPEGQLEVMLHIGEKLNRMRDNRRTAKNKQDAKDRNMTDANRKSKAAQDIAKNAREIERARRNGDANVDANIKNIEKATGELSQGMKEDAHRKEMYRRRGELEQAIENKTATEAKRNAAREELQKVNKDISDAKRETKREAKKTEAELKKLKAKREQLIDVIAAKETASENLRDATQQRRDAANELRKTNREIVTAEAKIKKLMVAMATDLKNANAAKQRAADVWSDAKDLAWIAKQYGDIAKKSGTDIVIPESLQREFLAAKTDEARQAAQDRIEYAIASQMIATPWEKLRAWRYFSMLGNPKTHIRNIVGNISQGAAVSAKDSVALIIESIALRDGQEKTKAIINPFSKSDKAYLDAANNSWENVQRTIDTGGKYDARTGIEAKRRMFGGLGIMESVRQFNMNALEWEDMIFLKRGYINAYAQYMKANKLSDANMTDVQTSRAVDYATNEALKATYHDANTTATALNKLEKTNVFTEFLIGGLFPFKKTPANILKRGVEYSPVGLVQGLVMATKDVRTGKVSATQAIDTISAGLTGTGIALIGMLAAKAGLVSPGGDDDDPERKNILDRQAGEQKYALKIGNITYTLESLAPSVMSFMFGAEIGNMLAWDFSNVPKALDAVVRSINPLFELSMLDGLTSALASYGGTGAEKMSDVLLAVTESFIGQHLPTLFGQVARTMDDTVRTTRSLKEGSVLKTADRLYKNLKSKIPGVATTLPAVIDLKGNEKKQVGKNIAARLFLNMFSPGFLAIDNSDEVDAEMLRLYDITGETSVLPRKTPTTIQYDGETLRLDDDEYSAFSVSYGMESYQAFSDLLASDEYKKMTDAEKADAIRRVSDRAYTLAKEDFLDGREMFDAAVSEFIDAALYGANGTKTPSDYEIELKDSDDFDARDVYQAAKDLSGLSKLGEKAKAVAGMDLSDDEKTFLYLTKVSTGEQAPAKLQTALETVTIDTILDAQARFVNPDTGEAMLIEAKANVLRDMTGLTDADKQAIAQYAMSESSGNKMQAAIDAGISADAFLDAYIKYREIDRDESLNSSKKAVEFSSWLNRFATSASGVLTKKQTEHLRESLRYDFMLSTSAGNYDKFYSIGISDDASLAFYDAIAKLEPTNGRETVSNNQRMTAVWKSTTGTRNEKLKAIRQILDDSGSGSDKFDALDKAGVPVGDILSFFTATADMESIKDKKGNTTTSKQEQVIAYIKKQKLSRAQKDALYLSMYASTTLEKNRAW